MMAKFEDVVLKDVSNSCCAFCFNAFRISWLERELFHVSPVRLEALSDANLSAVSFPWQPQ